MNETKIFKMPVKNNNKIDRIIFGKLTLPVIDWGYKNNLTPNFFTTLSFSFQLSSIYFLKNYNPTLFSFLYMLGYYFDCIDGPMARKYNMVTVFGDYYDHGTDIICFTLVNYYYFTLYNLLNQPFILLSYILMSYGLLKYVGIQERMYDSKKGDLERSPFLYWTTYILKHSDTLEMFKYFSYSVFVIFFSTIPVLICPK
jgi:phosphatidylglycerophosphate synthase